MGGWVVGGIRFGFDVLELLVERGGELELGPERPEVLPERKIGHHRRELVETFSFPELTWTRRFGYFSFLKIEIQIQIVKGLGALSRSSEAERAGGAQWWSRSGREAGFMDDNPMEGALGSRYDERARGSERRRPCGGLGSGPGGR